MKVIGFIDDAQYELDAFRSVIEQGADFKIITAKTPDVFLERLEGETKVDLLLFDLYFPDTSLGRKPGPALSTTELEAAVKRTEDACTAVVNARGAEDQMFVADFLRREASEPLKDMLERFAQGPAGGIKAFKKVRDRHPLVPSAFLSRKRTSEDVPECLHAGALAVLQKPMPSGTPLPAGKDNMARAGWEDHKEEFVQVFRALMSQDVVERYLTRVEEMLVSVDYAKARMIQKSIVAAKNLWINTGGDKRDISKFRALVERIKDQYAENFGYNATYDLLKFLAGLGAGTLV